nr:hypothetical protein [Bacteroidota bacterium]
MAKMNSLKDLFEDQLKLAYYAEMKIKQVLSDVIIIISSKQLKENSIKHIN